MSAERLLSKDYLPWTPVREMSVSVYNTEDTTPSPPERYETLGALVQLHELDDDWDGHESERPKPEVVDLAIKFVTHMPFQCRYPDQITPEPEGDVSLTWRDGEKSTIITFVPGGMHLSQASSAALNDGFYQDDIVFNGEIFPRQILPYIPNRPKRT